MLKKLADQSNITWKKQGRSSCHFLRRRLYKKSKALLNNKNTYKMLQQERTKTHKRVVNDTMKLFKNDK